MDSGLIVALLQKYKKVCVPNKVLTTELFLNFLSQNPINFWQRALAHPGHITVSAWVVSPDLKNVLMMHHRGIGKWVQLGGHIDEGETDIYNVALREVKEECGLDGTILSRDIFDIGHHVIPERPSKNEGEHEHFDIRFLVSVPFETPRMEAHSAYDVRWIPLQEMHALENTGEIATMIALTEKLS